MFQYSATKNFIVTKKTCEFSEKDVINWLGPYSIRLRAQGFTKFPMKIAKLLPETNMFAPENGWLEYWFPFGDGATWQVRSVSFRECRLYEPFKSRSFLASTRPGPSNDNRQVPMDLGLLELLVTSVFWSFPTWMSRWKLVTKLVSGL